MPKKYANFQLTIKVLIFNDKGDILVVHTPEGFMDFPGGRVDETEENFSYQDILQRELSEEIGDNFEYILGNFAFITRRFYKLYENNCHILAIFYEAKYLRGEIQLSKEHTSFEWINSKKLLKKNKNCFASTEEYIQLNQYFDR